MTNSQTSRVAANSASLVSQHGDSLALLKLTVFISKPNGETGGDKVNMWRSFCLFVSVCLCPNSPCVCCDQRKSLERPEQHFLVYMYLWCHWWHHWARQYMEGWGVGSHTHSTPTPDCHMVWSDLDSSSQAFFLVIHHFELVEVFKPHPPPSHQHKPTKITSENTV